MCGREGGHCRPDRASRIEHRGSRIERGTPDASRRCGSRRHRIRLRTRRTGAPGAAARRRPGGGSRCGGSDGLARPAPGPRAGSRSPALAAAPSRGSGVVRRGAFMGAVCVPDRIDKECAGHGRFQGHSRQTADCILVLVYSLTACRECGILVLVYGAPRPRAAAAGTGDLVLDRIPVSRDRRSK